MNFFSKLFYRYKKALKIARLYLLTAGPGIIVMVADNDAGGITTYTATGAQFGFHLNWFLILLGPIAYISIVAMLIIVSTLYAVSALFPNLLGG